MRRVIRFFISILLFEAICFFLLAVWIVYDGSREIIAPADAAFVPAYSEIKNGLLSPATEARLNRAAALFNDGKCSFIIVRGVTPPGEDDESEAMSRYLQAHSISENNIIQDHPGVKGSESFDTLIKIMKEQKIQSLLLVTDYYRIVHLKLVLAHAGEKQLGQAPVGQWTKDDMMKVVNEDIAMIKDMYNWYLLPESKIIGKKALEEANSIKESINSKIQSQQK